MLLVLSALSALPAPFGPALAADVRGWGLHAGLGDWAESLPLYERRGRREGCR